MTVKWDRFKRFIRSGCHRFHREIQSHEHIWRPVRLPHYLTDSPYVLQASIEDNADLGAWYSRVLIGPGTIGALATSMACLKKVILILQQLNPDLYVRYLLDYYEAGLSRFGEQWCYADITTVLFAASQLIKPRRYLEIGVRRGRSMAIVASNCPQCEMVGFDMWVEGYGLAENPGPDFVNQELGKLGFQGNAQFINGNSHRTLPEYFRSHPYEYFDLITVDGDHSQRGASLDLRDVLPRLKIGGVIVFDDIVQPDLEHLMRVWRRYVADQQRFATWEFCELGYGIAFGIRKY